MNYPIDIVVLWVDGNDPKWISDKKKYLINDEGVNTGISRYRDWNNMKYWFRSIEFFAPWIHKIHFVTYGHLPNFLNVNAPKLNIVNHKEIIPTEYLPTFNSEAIEININKIKGLAEHFIYFNDDMFLLKPVKKEDFFKNNVPVLEGLQGTITSVGDQSNYPHLMLNDVDIINKHFNKRRQTKNNWSKWYNYRYGPEIIRNIFLSPWKEYVGFKNAHLPVPFLKSTFDTVWEKEFKILDKTRQHRFRSFEDVNQYIFRYWQLASGNFEPHYQLGKRFEVSEKNIDEVVNEIVKQRHKEICLNDPDYEIDFELCSSRLIDAFKQILPQKSSFEK
ncbi:Stealth CR1 domain-containing protein [Limosilactobacillus reuteri]|uniref:Stealth CR1 domain-containing protein n=1 Tax=Limosilactobacillus reuteri TaxID=1598 RepID=UPI0023605703|nr:Stealth CR1 domain-containing protein [Limosilactobacillus reuteri]MDD1406673.1 Stealth CR1 domain-containing protein [Limosilactobacillus reuteri]